MSLIKDKYSDTVGRFRFSITSNLDYQEISEFYRITGGAPYLIEESADENCVFHLVRLCNLPSLIPMGAKTAPMYTAQFQTDDFDKGITRMIIRDSDSRCVLRYERDPSGSGWLTFASDKQKLKYFTD